MVARAAPRGEAANIRRVEQAARAGLAQGAIAGPERAGSVRSPSPANAEEAQVAVVPMEVECLAAAQVALEGWVALVATAARMVGAVDSAAASGVVRVRVAEATVVAAGAVDRMVGMEAR